MCHVEDNQIHFTLCLLTFLSYLVFTSALKDVNVEIVTPAIQGGPVELACNYDLEDENLYALRWLRNEILFYRYTPGDWPPGQFLPLPGIIVDLSKSGSHSLYLKNIDLSSAGIYRCEVFLDAPSFQSAEGEKEMDVIVLPAEGPHISGGQRNFDVGNTVAINCTSAKSKPAATLRWFINDQPTSDSGEYETEYSTTLYEDGLQTSSLSLRFMAGHRHFKDGNMRLKCTASVSRLHMLSNEESFIGGSRQSSQLEVYDDGRSIIGAGSRLDVCNSYHAYSAILVVLFFHS